MAQHPFSVDVTRSLPSLGRRRLTALFESGAVTSCPDGRGRGTVLIGTGGRPGRLVGKVLYVLWRGKLVDGDRRRLKNLFTPLELPAVAAAVYEGPSWHDGKPCIVLDYSKTSWVARLIRDEIREVGPGLFLGLLFLGRLHLFDFSLDFGR